MSKMNMLGLKSAPKELIDNILRHSDSMLDILLSGNKKHPALAGKSVYLLFYEPSTRTSSSFDTAAKMLGANCMSLAVGNSSVNKGETLIDTAQTLDAMGADVIVMRHSLGGAPTVFADKVNAAVINAGDGMGEHPTQALLDMFTIRKKRGSLDNLKIAIIGDVRFSRVARSNIWGLSAYGADIRVCAPATLMPADIGRLPVTVYNDPYKAAEDVDVVMGLRLQTERQSAGLLPSITEYNHYYGINQKLIGHAKDGALVMHPGPINRGAEINSDVADGINSVIREQVTSGVAVRAALMDILVNKKY